MTKHQATKTLRFYGLASSLRRWHNLLIATVGRESSGLKTETDRYGDRHYIEVAMTTDDREAMMAHWYAPSGTGLNGTGNLLRWNECVAYVEV